MKKVPDVRFKGFTDDWEQRKLGNIMEESFSKALDFEQNPLYSLTIQDGITPKTERYERGFLIQKKESIFKIVKSGEFVTNPMNLRFGALGYNKNPFSVSISGYYDVFSIDKNQCNAFWNAYLKTANTLKKFDNIATGSLIEKRRVKFSTLQTLSLLAPTTEIEKQKIGYFFESLDNDITLHQRKLDQLQTLKKYCLQNMFPAKEGKVPAIRFKGFTDDWKQHKLGELLAFRNGFNGNLQQYGSGIPLISVMDILNNSFIFSDTVQTKANLNETEIKRYIVHYGDVLFQRSSETVEDAGSSNVYLDSQNIAVFGGFVICGRKIGDYDPVFFRYLLDSNKIRHQIVIRAQGVQHINVSQDTLEDVSIDLPSKSEQKMIGVCLRNLDNFITLQQHKLDQLQSLKKFMLQNLFIQRK